MGTGRERGEMGSERMETGRGDNGVEMEGKGLWLAVDLWQMGENWGKSRQELREKELGTGINGKRLGGWDWEKAKEGVRYKLMFRGLLLEEINILTKR